MDPLPEVTGKSVPTTQAVTVKGLRECAADWRSTLAHASVVAHTVDSMDALRKSLPEDQQGVFSRQVEVAHAALSRMMISSAKSSTNHTLWVDR